MLAHFQVYVGVGVRANHVQRTAHVDIALDVVVKAQEVVGRDVCRGGK